MEPPFEPEDNPADVLLDVVSQSGNEMAERWSKHTQDTKGKDAPPALKTSDKKGREGRYSSESVIAGFFEGSVRPTAGIARQTIWLWYRSTILIVRKGVFPQVALFCGAHARHRRVATRAVAPPVAGANAGASACAACAQS